MMFSLSTEPPFDGVLAVSEMWEPRAESQGLRFGFLGFSIKGFRVFRA